MKRVLLVVHSPDFARHIQTELQKDHAVILCRDPAEAFARIKEHPDGMILEMDLPGTDGLSFLESLSWVPPVILSLAACYTPFEYQRLKELGVGSFLRTPCHYRAVANRFRSMMESRHTDHNDPEKLAAEQLTKLGISPGEGGGRHLRIGIPLYAQDPDQKISKELYPAIATICGTTPSGVEIQIRRTITDAWKNRDPESWEVFFPNLKRQPANKRFLSALAEKLY